MQAHAEAQARNGCEGRVGFLSGKSIKSEDEGANGAAERAKCNGDIVRPQWRQTRQLGQRQLVEALLPKGAGLKGGGSWHNS